MAKNRIVFSNDFILKDEKIGINTSVPKATLDVVGDIYFSGVTTSLGGFVGDLTGNVVGDITGTITGTASTASSLETPRTFEITGDVVASPVSFDGTGNVSLAATIQPNSVGLGTDTFGDYVESITGTSNEIEVTGGTGEGSTPQIGLPNDVTITQDLTVNRDVQIVRNLNVDGNITIGGTTATLFTTTLEVADPDLILGVRTDALGNDISTDNTANHGGIAIASTEGNPLVVLTNIGAGETLPTTYKKIMWFKSGSFAGLGTDAWLSNYAVGIGSTQFPTGTRLAAGSVQFTENDLAVVRNINASGIITASNFSGNADSTTNILGGDVGDIPYQSSTDTTTFVDASSASSGQILLYNGSIPIWSNVSNASGAFGGITVYDEGNLVGTSGSITSLNFVSPNLVVTATSGANGIATVTMSDNIVGTSLSISGISTFNDTITANRYGITSGTILRSGNITGITTGSGASFNHVYGSNSLLITNSGGGSGFRSFRYNNIFGSNIGDNLSWQAGGLNQYWSWNNVIGHESLRNFNFNGGSTTLGRVGYNNIIGFQIAGTSTGGNTNFLYNNIIGYQAGYTLGGATATGNNIFGYQSGYNVTSGSYNVFNGYQAGYSNVTGSYNIGIGYSAGQVNMTGSRNIVIGYNRDVPSAAGNDQLVIGSNTDDWIIGDSSYNIGLGTASPTSKLHVVGDVLVTGDITATTFSGDATNVIGGIASVTSLSVSGISTLGTVEISSGIVTATSGVVTYYGDGSNLTGVAAEGGVSISTQTSDQAQYIPYATSFGSTTGLGATSLYVFNPSNSRLGIGTTNPQYNLQVIGDFAATSKSFVIDHPTKPDKKLRYASLEGPENGVYVRGRSQEAVIELPDYWTELVDNNTITVNLTPIGRSATPRVDCQEINNNIINVFSVEEGELDYYYTVYGERKDIDKLIVEY